jgi:hypothetical protein
VDAFLVIFVPTQKQQRNGDDDQQDRRPPTKANLSEALFHGSVFCGLMGLNVRDGDGLGTCKGGSASIAFL